MARKKYKNIKLEQNDLVPVSIGIFESRKKSSIGTLLILGIFILAVIYMPEISDKINSYLDTKTNVNNPIKNPNNPDDPKHPVVNPPTEDNDNFSAFTTDLKIENDDIIVSNFVIDKDNLTLSYDVTNNGNGQVNLESLNYYIEVFNSEQTFIERVKLANDNILNSGAFINYKRIISNDLADTIGFISIVKKNDSDYPLVELSDNAMVCSNNHEKITYKFQESKLKEVSSEISYKNTDTNYEAIYTDNKAKASSYNNVIGVTSNFFDTMDGYNITSVINLNEASRMYLFNADSFNLDTEPKVVKFEMEAQGFKCE